MVLRLERMEERDDEGMIRGREDFLIETKRRGQNELTQRDEEEVRERAHLLSQCSLDLVPFDHLLLRQNCNMRKEERGVSSE